MRRLYALSLFGQELLLKSASDLDFGVQVKVLEDGHREARACCLLVDHEVELAIFELDPLHFLQEFSC